MVFRSKIDVWLAGVLLAAEMVTLIAVGVAMRQVSGSALIIVLIGVAAGMALPLWILASTYYVVNNDTLHVRSGPFRWRIAISSITSIQPSRSLLSSPALSLQRLRIEYGRGQFILLSPRDQQAFMRAIEGAQQAD